MDVVGQQTCIVDVQLIQSPQQMGDGVKTEQNKFSAERFLDLVDLECGRCDGQHTASKAGQLPECMSHVGLIQLRQNQQRQSSISLPIQPHDDLQTALIWRRYEEQILTASPSGGRRRQN